MPDSQPQPPPTRRATARHPHAETAALLLCGARLTDGRTVDVRLGGGRIEAVGTAGSLAPGARGSPRVDLARLPAAARPRRAARPLRHRPHRRRRRPVSVRHRGRPAPRHRGRPAAARPRRDGAAHARARSATCTGCGAAGGGAPGAAVAARAGGADGGRGAAAAHRARRAPTGSAMLRDAVKMGAVGGRRLPGPRPRSDRVRRGRPRARRRARLPRRPAHRRATTRPGSPGSRRWPAGCGPGVDPRPVRAGSAGCPPTWPARAADQLAAAGVTVVCLPQGGCGGRRTARGARARTAAARGRRTGRGGQRRAARRRQPGGPRRPAGGRLSAGLAGRAAARGGVRGGERARPGPPWGCPRCGWRRASRRSCSRCAATGSRGCCRSRTAGS